MVEIETLPPGLQIRVARVVAALTLDDVARMADVSPVRLSEWERGLRSALSPDAVRRVREALAISTETTEVVGVR